MSNFKKVRLKWIFIDNFWRLFPVATEKRCLLRTGWPCNPHKVAGSLQTGASGDFSKSLAHSPASLGFWCFTALPRQWNERG